MLKRVAAGFGVMVLVVLAVGLGLVTASRMRAPTAEQQAALQLLEDSTPPAGSNAYPDLLLMTYDVPGSEVDAVAAAESERFNATPPGTAGFELQVPYERMPADPARAENCSWREPGCLDKVRSNRGSIAARMDDQQALLQRIAGLSRHGHYRSLMDLRIDTMIPELQQLNASTTHHALRFVDGDIEAGLAGVCGDALTWRRLTPNADSLIVSMVGAAIIEGSTQLFAEMLESLPAKHPLPAVCATAFAPPAPGELSLCQAMRGEARMSASHGELAMAEAAKGPALERAWQRVVYDPGKTQALMAPSFAWACSEQARESIEKDVPALRPRTEGRSWLRFECAGNAAGCILADIAAPAYRDYALRLQDTGMVLRTMGTVLWIRERRAAGDVRTVAELVADQPGGWASASRPVQVVEAGAALQVARFDEGRGKVLRLPLGN